MNVRWRFRAAAVFAVCALFSLAAAGVAGSAPRVTPPAGSPDLSQMALLPSDFTSTNVTSEGYQSSSDFVAVYGREFGPSRIVSGARFLAVYSEVDLATDADSASVFFSALEVAVRTPSIRAQLVQAIVTGSGRTVRKKDIHIGRPRDLHLGEGAVLLPIRVRIRGIRFDFDLIFLQRDRVIGLLLAGGMPAKAIKLADASYLANTMIDHVNFGLSPQPTTPPTISGTPAQGQTLTASTGSWNNNPTSFTYQWQRCDQTGANCQPISGATTNAYTVATIDSGHTIRVTVVAKNNIGSSQPATSSPTTPIP